MQKNRWCNIICFLLTVILLVNTVVPAMVQATNRTGTETEAENPLTPDYILPAWPEESADEPLEQKKPAVYQDGQILLYHYQQLLLIGSGAPVTDTDYLTNQCGAGQQVLSDVGQAVCYAPDASYQIVQDIPLPRHTTWQLPDNFTGTLTGSPLSEPILYDDEKDTIYLYNLLQTAVMSSSDAETEPVMSGDAAAATFGTGNVLYPHGGEHYLTYSGKHSYVLAKGFSSALTNLSPSVRLPNRAPAQSCACPQNYHCPL